MDLMNNPNARITICKHIFCSNCIEAAIRLQHKCPLCRAELPSAEKTLVAPADETHEDEENPTPLESVGQGSSKLDALLHILEGIAYDSSAEISYQE